MAGGGAELGALYPAVAAVLICLAGIAERLYTARRRRRAEGAAAEPVDTTEKSDVGTLLAALGKAAVREAALEQQVTRWRDRAISCEARESARVPDQRQEQP